MPIMNRKILKAGPTTLAISLPMEYVKKYRLKSGDELSVEAQGPSLKIMTTNVMAEDSASVIISKLSPMATKIIGTLYKLGYKRIKAYYDPNGVELHRGKKTSELDMAKNTFNHLIGMQIQEVRKSGKENYIVCEEKAVLSVKEFDNTFNQLFLHLITQGENCIESFAKKEVNDDEAYLIETLINQSADFCIRILSTSGYPDHKKTAVYFSLVSMLENIGDRMYALLVTLAKEKDDVDKESVAILKDVLSFIRTASSIHRKYDEKLMNNFVKEVSASLELYRKVLSKSKKNGLYSYDIYVILLNLEEIIELLYGLNYKNFNF